VGSVAVNGAVTPVDKSITAAKYIVGATPQYILVNDTTGSVSAISVADGTVTSVAWSTTGNDNGAIAAAETLVLTFSGAMTATAVNNGNIDVVILPSAHSHLDGAGAIGSATWSVGNTVLTVVYSAGTSAPTLVTADTLTYTLLDANGNVSVIAPYTVLATDF